MLGPHCSREVICLQATLGIVGEMDIEADCNVTSTEMEIYGLPVPHVGKKCPSLRQKEGMNVS